MAGTFGYELDPLKLSEEEKDQIREQIRTFKGYYDLIQQGEYYRLTNPFVDEVYNAWELARADGSEALVSVVAALILLVVLRRRFAGREYRIPLAVDLTRQAEWARAWKAHTGEEWVPGETESLPATASHAEFVEATKRMNERFDLSRMETAVQAWQAARAPADVPTEEEKGEQSDGGTDH